MLTREEMIELKSVVRRTLEEEMEMYNEVWLTAEELHKWFGTFTKSWLERYGQALPRRQPQVLDETGAYHKTAHIYPKNQIQRMISNGQIEELVCKAVVIR